MSGSISKWLIPLLLLMGLWVALVGLFAGHLIMTTDREWHVALEQAARFWLPWLPLLPLTARLSLLFPLDRGRPLVSILVHLAACAAVVLICQQFMPERPPSPGREASRMARDEAREFPDGPPRDAADRPPRDRDGSPPPWARGPRGGGSPEERRNSPRGMWRPFNIRSIIDIIVYGAVVSLSHAVSIWQRSRQRELRALELEASLAHARLDALRLQINPHFLFNTLNAIASLIHTRPDAADDMTGSLSELLRASLHGGGTHEVPLSEEMEMLRLFTGIERTRFGDRIRFQEDIAPDTLTAKIPSLILQPMVENAIRHGLDPQVGEGTVTVRSRRERERLILTVSDNGAGYSPDKESTAREGPGGIGLTNSRDRLNALYGREQSLTIAPGPSGGTEITIDIPWHTA